MVNSKFEPKFNEKKAQYSGPGWREDEGTAVKYKICAIMLELYKTDPFLFTCNILFLGGDSVGIRAKKEGVEVMKQLLCHVVG